MVSAQLLISWIVVLILFVIACGVAFVEGMKVAYRVVFKNCDVFIKMLEMRKNGVDDIEEVRRLVKQMKY